MNYNGNNLGEIIKIKREEKGYSIRELSRLSGISHTTICDIESGIANNSSFNTIAKIARVLNIDINKFINNLDKDDKNNNVFIVKRTKENVLEIEYENFDDVIDFMQNFDYDFDSLLPNIGDKIEVNNGENFSDSNQENLFICPNIEIEE